MVLSHCLKARPIQRQSSPIALLLIDVINPMDFEGGDALLEAAMRVAPNLRRLQRRARALHVPVIYVNDNFDCWHLGFRELVEALRSDRVPGAPLIDMFEPDHGLDYYILKPLHSGFFRTGLEVLLRRLQVQTLVLTGFAGDICVLFTANDAYMRGFKVVVAADCVASEREDDNVHALRQMERLLKAKVTNADDVRLGQFARPPDSDGPGHG